MSLWAYLGHFKHRILSGKRQLEIRTGDPKIFNFNPTANSEDIKYCYRLLLGRAPDKEGWDAFNKMVEGRSFKLDLLTKIFLNSPEFKSRNLLKSFEESKPVLVDLNEFKMYVFPDDSLIGKSILEKRIYESHVTRSLKAELSPGKVFLDIGANIGYFSLLAARWVGKEGKVFSFEPFHFNYSLLYLSAQANGFDNINIYPFAVAEKRSAFIFDHIDSNGIISDFNNDPNLVAQREIILSIPLDEILANVDKIDVMKIDIEGAEYRALQGGINTIKKFRPIIFSEFSPGGLKNVSKITGEQYLQFIISQDYDIFILSWEGKTIECHRDIKKVIDYYEEQRTTHVDLVFYPSKIRKEKAPSPPIP